MKVGERVAIGTLIVLGILLTSIYLPSITGKIEASELEKSNLSGEFLSVGYEPKEPKTNERLTVTAIVRNNGKERNDYLLTLKIIKNGEVKYKDDFTFSLLADGMVSLSPVYIPYEIGEYEIILRIYDKDSIRLYDEKILTFATQSDIGPFDLEVDMPSHVIGLGDSLPFTVKITNVGTHGIDVGLNLDLYCTSGKNISKNTYVFVNGSSYISKQFFMRTCEDVGQHSLVASLILDGKEMLLSKNQFFVNGDMPEIYISIQHWIKPKAGETTNFAIVLTNPNGIDLINLRPFVYGIPAEWLSIMPSNIDVLKPNQTIAFVAKLDVPEDAEEKSYEMTIGVGGNNMFAKSEAILSVTGATTGLPVSITSFYQLLSSYWVQIVLTLVTILLIFLLFMFKRRNEQDRKTVLEKIKDTMR